MQNFGIMRWVLAAGVLLCMVQLGSALRCYVEKSGLTYGHQTMECPRDWICVKKREMYSEEPDIRTSACSSKYSGPPNPPCVWQESLNDGKRTHSCYCNTDLCNTGTSLGSGNVYATWIFALVVSLGVLMNK